MSSKSSVDGISTRIAKQLKRMCSTDNDFLEQSKKNIQLTWIFIRAFEKINRQLRPTFPRKKAKQNMKPLIFPNLTDLIARAVP